MLAEYVKYKAKMNPTKKTQTAVKVSKAQSAFNAMDNTEGKIKTLEIQTLSPEEKQNFTIALRNMKQTIEKALAAVTQPPPEDGEPKPSKNLA